MGKYFTILEKKLLYLFLKILHLAAQSFFHVQICV